MKYYITIFCKNVFIILVRVHILIFVETSIDDKKFESILNQPKTDPKTDQRDWYFKIARKIFVKKLQLDNEDLLLGKVEIRKIPTNTYVMQEDSHKV